MKPKYIYNFLFAATFLVTVAQVIHQLPLSTTTTITNVYAP